ncbi:glycosyltransferase family 39 protein [Anabaenopsis tanganyikae CS-531]|nr:glycosyltransferase family 39 protein [Anabaenopsis tanganyikae]MDH6104937.1 glycosyltransferase family 39 protein [Anabaenopsis tanganyikae CS-531]
MGQSILNGNLPYVEIWDLKPPLAFFSYALPILAFGKSIISIRLFGTICVIISAILTYYICRCVWGRKLSLLAAIIFVILTGPLMDGKSTMTEHIAIVPLLGSLALLLKELKLSNLKFFIVGLLMGTACMIRLNLAYVALILGLYIAARSINNFNLHYKCLLSIFAYGIGCLIPFIVLFLPYIATNNFALFKAAVIDASLAYSHSQIPFWQIIFKQIYDIWGIIFLIGCYQIILIIKQQKKYSQQRNKFIYLLIYFFGTEWSILNSGAAHSHYMIQLAPFFALVLASWLMKILDLNLKAGYFILIVTLMLTVTPSLNEYKTIGVRLVTQQSILYGKEYDLAKYLAEQGGSDITAYMMDHHLVYWLLNLKPPTKIVTHPSNISKEYLLRVLQGPTANTNQALLEVLAQKPEFIVKKENVWYLQSHPEAIALLEKTLKTDYTLLRNMETTQIYRKISEVKQ